MADDKEILLSVNLDTSEAGKGADELNKKLDNLNNKNLDKPFKSFRQEIKEATNDLKKTEEQFGRNSKQFTDAAKKVADLRDRFSETNQVINGFNPDNKLQSLVSLAKGATGAIQGVTGAMTFLGLESGTAEESIKKLQALMLFGDALNSVDDIKNSFQNFGQVISSTSAYQAINNGLTSAAGGIYKLLGIEVEASSTSFKVLKGAIAATGIGLLVVAIGAVVEHLDELKEALGFTNGELEAVKKTTEDYNKAAQSAAEKVSKVKSAFDLARQGVISKREALQVYNTTLGDSLGKTNNLQKAEELLASKAQTYIQITGLKAQANALFAASADQTAKALTATNEDQTDFLDKSKAILANYFSAGSGAAIAIDAQQKGVQEAVDKANKNAEALQKKGEELLQQAAELGKQSGVNADVVDVQKDLDKQDDERRQKQKEKDEKYRLNRIEQEKITSKLIQDARLASIQDAFFKQQATLTTQEQEELDTQLESLNKKLINDEDYQLRKKAIEDKYSVLQSQLLVEKAKQDEEAALKAVKDVHDSLLKDFSDNKTLADANVITTEQANQPDENDDIEIAKAKIQEILQAKIDAENEAFEFEKAQKIGNDAELELLEAQHLANLSNLKKDAAEANIAIDNKETESRQQNFEAVRGMLTAAGSLFAKNTVAYKAIAIAQTTMDTYQSAQKAYNSLAGIPYVGPVLGGVAAAAAVAAGVANVKKILSVKVPNSGGGDGGGTPAPSAITSAPIVSASATVPLKVQDVRVTNPNQQEPVRAYIVQSDLDSNERKTKFLNSVSSF